jgi:two-component system, response regulator, stage 0 sporulation protein F
MSAMGKSLHILVVDDRPDSVLFLTEFLLSRQHRVETSNSGAEALEAIIRRHRTPQAYSLLISDVSMPGMDGITLIKELRRRGILLPIALYTAYGAMHPNLAQEARALNCLAVLDKPIELRRVEHVINDALAQRSGTVREEKEQPFFGTSRVARTPTESIRQQIATPEELSAPPSDGMALEKRNRSPEPTVTPRPPHPPEAPMPPILPLSIRTPLPFPVQSVEPQTRSLPSFRTPVSQESRNKDSTGRTINPKFRTPLPFLQGNPPPIAPPVIPPQVAAAPTLRPPGPTTPLPVDQEQELPTTSFIRRSVESPPRNKTGQFRKGTGTTTNAHVAPNPPSARIRRTVTGSYTPPTNSTGQPTTSIGRTRAVACAHCDKIFMVAIRPASFTSVCVHCGQLNRIDPL